MNSFNVLLIDDEEELISTLVERLEIRGIKADAVTNGHDALEKMRSVRYSVVVVDFKMPGLGGDEVIEVIKDLYPETKIILITGHGNTMHDDDEQDPEVVGAHDILMKPFSIDQLIQTINLALKPGE